MTTKHKYKLLIVGAFPSKNKKKIYGGQVSACTALIESSFTSTFFTRTLDSTQISNPPPHLLLRMFLALKRVIIFIFDLIFHTPDATIIFVASGSSAYEKGLMVLISKALKIPTLIFPRAGALISDYQNNKKFSIIVRNTLAKADMFLCQGKSFQNFAIEELGFPKSYAPIIPNWTAPPNLIKIGKNRNYQGDNKTLKILFLAWLEEFKGVFELLKAAKLLKDQQIPFHLTFGGAGSALQEAQLYVNNNRLNDVITFSGWVDGEEKLSLLRSSNVFVLPSWNEGLPNAMIEAMSAGLACVVSNVGVISNYATNNKEALIIQPKNVEELFSALKTLAMDASMIEEIAQGGFKLAESKFSMEHGVKIFEKAVFLALSTDTKQAC